MNDVRQEGDGEPMTEGLRDYLILVALGVMAAWAAATYYGLADLGWPIWIVLGAGTLYMLRIAMLCLLFLWDDHTRDRGGY
jgi:hypothetical protein